MDSAHNLVLNEEAFKKIEEHKKPVYVFEWLRSLDKLLLVAQKVSFIYINKSIEYTANFSHIFWDFFLSKRRM